MEHYFVIIWGDAGLPSSYKLQGDTFLPQDLLKQVNETEVDIFQFKDSRFKRALVSEVDDPENEGKKILEVAAWENVPVIA